MSTNGIADIVVSPYFLYFCIFGLIGASAWRIWSAERRISAETRDAKDAIRIIADNAPPDLRLSALRQFAKPDDGGTELSGAWGGQASSIRTALASFVMAMREAPRASHVREGLRPAKNWVSAELKRGLPRSSDFSDTIIRLSLLGTFAGLIAALSIASSNIGANLGQGADATPQMQGFLEQLLKTAAVKFWISAVGLFLALVLRHWQTRLNNRATAIARKLGDTLDEALDNPRTVAVWNAEASVAGDPIARQIHEIADQIRDNADKWILTIQIGGAGAAPPKAELITRTTS